MVSVGVGRTRGLHEALSKQMLRAATDRSALSMNRDEEGLLSTPSIGIYPKLRQALR